VGGGRERRKKKLKGCDGVARKNKKTQQKAQQGVKGGAKNPPRQKKREGRVQKT